MKRFESEETRVKQNSFSYEKVRMSDYSSFLYAITNLFNDPAPEVARCASEAIIEVAKSNPNIICKTMLADLNSFTGSGQKNRSVLILALKEIVTKYFNYDLIEIISPQLINLISFNPPVDISISEPCIEMMDFFADRNPQHTLSQFKDFNNTHSLISFLLARANKRELTFFVTNSKPSDVFRKVVDNMSKTTDEKTRENICKLFVEVADVVSENNQNGSCLSPLFGEAMEHLSTIWYKSATDTVRNAILECIGSVASALGTSEMKARISNFFPIFFESITKPDLRLSSAKGLSSLIISLENLDSQPTIPVAQLSTSLYKFIDSEFSKRNEDGKILKTINSAIGALSTIMNLHPNGPLTLTIQKLPTIPSLYIMNVFCSCFGQTEHAVDIIEAMGNVQFATFSQEQKEMYCQCFFSLLKKCITKLPQVADILTNIVTFISDSHDKAKDTILEFTLTVKQAQFCFPHLYPTLFSLMLNPYYFYATPTMINVMSLVAQFIPKQLRQLQYANIELSQIISLLCMFYYSELFTRESKQQLELILSALGQLPVQPTNEILSEILKKNNDQEFHKQLMKDCQTQYTKYINFATNPKGDKFLFSPKNRSALKAGNNVYLGHLFESPACLSQLDSVNSELFAVFLQNEFLEIQGIAEYIGLLGKFKPDYALHFLQTQQELLIFNQENKLKFWKKKDKPTIPPTAAIYGSAEVIEHSPQATEKLNNLFKNSLELMKKSQVSDFIRMKLIHAAFTRNSKDGSFHIENPKSFVDQATKAVESARDYDNLSIILDALIAAYDNSSTLIDQPQNTISEIFKQIKPEFLPYEVEDIVNKAAHITATVVSALTGEQDSSYLVAFHQQLLPYLVHEYNTPYVKAMLTVTESYKSINKFDPQKLIQLAVFYLVFQFANNKEIIDPSSKITDKLLSLVYGGGYKFITIEAAAQTLADFPLEGIIQIVFSELSSFKQHPYNYQKSAGSILHAFTQTKQALSSPAAFAHEFIQVNLDIHESFLSLLKLDAQGVIEQLLNEPVDAKLCSIVSYLFSNNEVKDKVFNLILDNKESSKVLSLLHGVRFKIPFSENKERLYFALTGINEELKSAETATLICDILNVGLNEPEFLKEGPTKELLSTEESIKAWKTIFEAIICSKDPIQVDRLFELCKSTQSSLVSSLIAGTLLANSTNPTLCHDVVMYLINPNEPVPCVVAQNIRSVGMLAHSSQEVRNKEGYKAIQFLASKIEEHTEYSLHSLLMILGTVSDEIIDNLSKQLILIVQDLLVTKSDECAVCGMNIINLICKANTNVLQELFNILTLVILHSFAHDTIITFNTLSQIFQKLGLIQLRYVSTSITDFVDANHLFFTTQVKDYNAFVDEVQRCKAHHNSSVRAAYAYVLSLILRRSGDRISERKQDVLDDIQDKMRDESPIVRFTAARAIALLQSS